MAMNTPIHIHSTTAGLNALSRARMTNTTIGWVIPCAVGAGLCITLGVLLNASLEETIYSLFHFIFGAVLAAWFFRVVIRRRVILLTSPVGMLVLIHLLYFTMSAIKYYDPLSAYPQFDLSLEQRAFGSLVGAITLAAMIWFFSAKGFRPEVQIPWVRVGGVALVCLFVMGIFFKVYLRGLGYGATYATVGSEYSLANMREYDDFFMFFASNSLSGILVVLGAIFFWQGSSWQNRLMGLLVVLTEVGWSASVFSSRGALLMMLLTFITAMQIRRFVTSIRLVKLLLTVLPLLGLVGSDALLSRLGRETRGGGLQGNVAEMTYRFELTDFAVALLESPGFQPDVRVMTDGASNAIPRFMFPMKDSTFEDAYNGIVSDLGWQPSWQIIDYTDTLFSAGAMAFGRLGFFLVPILYVVFLAGITRSMVRSISARGTPLFVLIVLTSNYIELGWSELFLTWRNLFIAFGAVVFLMVLARRYWARMRRDV